MSHNGNHNKNILTNHSGDSNSTFTTTKVPPPISGAVWAAVGNKFEKRTDSRLAQPVGKVDGNKSANFHTVAASIGASSINIASANTISATGSDTASKAPSGGIGSSKDLARPRRKKARRACFACQRAHLTCGDERPCQRCVKRGIGDQCHDGVRKKTKYFNEIRGEAWLSRYIHHQMHNEAQILAADVIPRLTSSNQSIPRQPMHPYALDQTKPIPLKSHVQVSPLAQGQAFPLVASNLQKQAHLAHMSQHSQQAARIAAGQYPQSVNQVQAPAHCVTGLVQQQQQQQFVKYPLRDQLSRYVPAPTPTPGSVYHAISFQSDPSFYSTPYQTDMPDGSSVGGGGNEAISRSLRFPANSNCPSKVPSSSSANFTMLPVEKGTAMNCGSAPINHISSVSAVSYSSGSGSSNGTLDSRCSSAERNYLFNYAGDCGLVSGRSGLTDEEFFSSYGTGDTTSLANLSFGSEFNLGQAWETMDVNALTQASCDMIGSTNSMTDLRFPNSVDFDSSISGAKLPPTPYSSPLPSMGFSVSSSPLIASTHGYIESIASNTNNLDMICNGPRNMPGESHAVSGQWTNSSVSQQLRDEVGEACRIVPEEESKRLIEEMKIYSLQASDECSTITKETLNGPRTMVAAAAVTTAAGGGRMICRQIDEEDSVANSSVEIGQAGTGMPMISRKVRKSGMDEKASWASLSPVLAGLSSPGAVHERSINSSVGQEYYNYGEKHEGSESSFFLDLI